MIGGVLLLELLATRVVFTADDDFAYVLGHRIDYVCPAKQRLGVPCPTCGLTRGFVLTVHGRIRQGWRMSPAGPLAATGILSAGLLFLILGALQRRQLHVQIASMRRWVRAGAVLYASGGAVVWMTAWISAVTRLRAHP